MRLAIAHENQHPLHEELVSAALAAAAEIGVEAERLSDPRDEWRFDAVLLLGYPHYYPSLRRAPRATRRISWYGENLPSEGPTRSESMARLLPSARMLDVAHDTFGRLLGPRSRGRLLRMRESAAAQRELGRNMAELRAARAWIDELVVVSSNRVSGAHLAGWQPRRVPFGYHAVMAGPLVAPSSAGRDIDVLFLGRDVHARGRRARALADFRRRLGGRAEVTVVDGGAMGAERHALLARTKVIVDIHRLPGNSTGIRYVLATAGGAALVNEETFDEWLPNPHELVVEVARDRLADEVVDLLADEPRRRHLVEAGQELLRIDLSMARCLAQVIQPNAPLPDASQRASAAR